MSDASKTLREMLYHTLSAPQRLSHQVVKALGGSILPEDHPFAWGNRFRTDYTRPLQQTVESKDETKAQDLNQVVKESKDGFLANVDVSHFIPEEITVKHENGWITVEGKHEERRDDHGTVWRHFVRKYQLPEGHDANKVVSTLSSDGVLTIRAPRLILNNSGKECKVSVVQPGKRTNDNPTTNGNDAKKVKQ